VEPITGIGQLKLEVLLTNQAEVQNGFKQLINNSKVEQYQMRQLVDRAVFMLRVLLQLEVQQARQEVINITYLILAEPLVLQAEAMLLKCL